MSRNTPENVDLETGVPPENDDLETGDPADSDLESDEAEEQSKEATKRFSPMLMLYTILFFWTKPFAALLSPRMAKKKLVAQAVEGASKLEQGQITVHVCRSEVDALPPADALGSSCGAVGLDRTDASVALDTERGTDATDRAGDPHAGAAVANEDAVIAGFNGDSSSKDLVRPELVLADAQLAGRPERTNEHGESFSSGSKSGSESASGKSQSETSCSHTESSPEGLRASGNTAVDRRCAGHGRSRSRSGSSQPNVEGGLLSTFFGWKKGGTGEAAGKQLVKQSRASKARSGHGGGSGGSSSEGEPSSSVDASSDDSDKPAREREAPPKGSFWGRRGRRLRHNHTDAHEAVRNLTPLQPHLFPV